MVYTAHQKGMKNLLRSVKLTMLRDAKTTSIAKRIRRLPLGGGEPTFFLWRIHDIYLVANYICIRTPICDPTRRTDALGIWLDSCGKPLLR